MGEEIGAKQQAELFLDMVLNSLTMLILGGYALFLVDDGFSSVILIRDFIYINFKSYLFMPSALS